MICPTCKYDAPYTQLQWEHRKRELERNPDINIFPCPDCGGTEYMLSDINIGQQPPRQYDGMLTNKPPGRVRLTKELRPPRSLWARLLDWWNERRSPWTN